MIKQFWINLPVKDTDKSKEFFMKLGFKINEQRSHKEMLSLFVGDKNVVVNLFTESLFKSFTKNELPDLKKGTEVLFSIDAETTAEVDQLAKKAKDAGGTIYAEPGGKDGWMYGCGFADLDGHRWNVLYMDMSKMPK
jgi:predicted lactoylglutathione lyase